MANNKDLFTCTGCKSIWWEKIKAGQFSSAASSSFFQMPDELTFHYVLRCLGCGDYQELPLQESSGNQATKDEYQTLVKTLQGKSDVK